MDGRIYKIDLEEADKYDPYAIPIVDVLKSVNIKALENGAVEVLSDLSREDEKEVLAELVALYGE